MDDLTRITVVDDNRSRGMNDELGFNTQGLNIIIGCGGIGFWLGLLIAMMGGQKFLLMDGDHIDSTNLSRLPVPQTWVGQNKAVALRKMIRSLRPDTIVTVISTHITPDTLDLIPKVYEGIEPHNYYSNTLPNVDVWDTTDDAEIQVKIHDTVDAIKQTSNHRRRPIMYRKIGYEGFSVGSYGNYQVWTQDNYTTGYRTTQANAVSSVLSAGLGFFARFIVSNEDVSVNLRTLLETGGARGRVEHGGENGDS